MKNNKGFTLIEIVMVIMLLGILAAVALPKYVDLSNKAKEGVRDGALGSIRAVVAMQYAENILNKRAYLFPLSLQPTMFADSIVPMNPVTDKNDISMTTSIEVGWRYYPTTGTVEAGIATP